MAHDSARLLRERHALISAFDRRVSQIRRAGDAASAREASALRNKALAWIARLEWEAPAGQAARSSE